MLIHVGAGHAQRRQHNRRQSADLHGRARRMLDWCVAIQYPEGGFQGGKIDATPKVPVTFNTGQILLGRWDDLSGYESFVQALSTAMSGDAGFLQSLYNLAKVVVLDWGLAMYIGAIPWAALAGWLGYRLGLRFVIAYRAARARRWARRAAHYAELGGKRPNPASDPTQ